MDEKVYRFSFAVLGGSCLHDCHVLLGIDGRAPEQITSQSAK